MKTLVIVIWVFLAFYSALSIWIPGLRVIDWKGTGKQLGAVSYIGFAMVFWSPALIVTGLVPESLGVAIYLLMLLGIFVAVIGYVIDIV